MKNKLSILTLIFAFSFLSLQAQRGTRVGYIDTEYILGKVSSYQQASNELERKVQEWKKEIEKKFNELEKKKLALEAERVLLTDELIEERKEDIRLEEKEILDYQQKRFGPKGDLFVQREKLIQPIQDQILVIVKDIAESKKLDFVIDKSSVGSMLYSSERFDMSDLVIKSIDRAEKREQAENRNNKKKAREESVVPILEEGDIGYEKQFSEEERDREERKKKKLAEREARKKALDEKRKKILEERENARKERIKERNSDNEEQETNKSENQ